MLLTELELMCSRLGTLPTERSTGSVTCVATS